MSECSIIDCSNSVVGRGWCKMHYTRWLRHGDPNFTVILPKGIQDGHICLIPNCKSPSKWKGFCKKHYKRQWRHGDPIKTLINMDYLPENCKAPGCVEFARYPTTGLCHTHHLRVTRYGRFEPMRGKKGAVRENTSGYRVFVIGGKFKYEHIMLAEKALGKPLPKGAVVHHFNEKKSDNHTPFNLIICPDQAYHLLLHRRAKELKIFGYCKSVNYEAKQRPGE